MAEVVCEEAFNDKFLFTEEMGWYQYTGTHWKNCLDKPPKEAIRQFFLQKFSDAVLKYKDDMTPQNRDEMNAWKGFITSAAVDRVYNRALGIKTIFKSINDFDIDPDILNTPSGVVHLPTKTIFDHDPQYLLTRITAVPYIPDMTNDTWNKALEAIPKDELTWMQYRYGQGVTGYSPPDDTLLLEYGTGANGKSTIVDAIAHALGSVDNKSGYYRSMSSKILDPNAGKEPTEMMDLKGVRFAQFEEMPNGRRLDVPKMKKIVGTEEITARPHYVASVTYKATHSLFITTNYEVTVSETDGGTWRRLIYYKYPMTYVPKHELERIKSSVPPEERYKYRIADTDIKQIARTDQEVHRACLTWLIDGAHLWYLNGKKFPETPIRVQKDTQEWRAGQDIIMSFIHECMILDPRSMVSTSETLHSMNEWLRDNGHAVWSSVTFASKISSHQYLQEHGVQKRKIRPNSKELRFSRPTMFYKTDNISETSSSPIWMIQGLRFREKRDDD